MRPLGGRLDESEMLGSTPYTYYGGERPLGRPETPLSPLHSAPKRRALPSSGRSFPEAQRQCEPPKHLQDPKSQACLAGPGRKRALPAVPRIQNLPHLRHRSAQSPGQGCPHTPLVHADSFSPIQTGPQQEARWEFGRH